MPDTGPAQQRERAPGSLTQEPTANGRFLNLSD